MEKLLAGKLGKEGVRQCNAAEGWGCEVVCMKLLWGYISERKIERDVSD